MNCKLKKNDLVQVMSGKEKGKSGKITEINVKDSRVFIAGVNLVKKAVKRKSQQDAGGIISIEAALPISKVKLVVGGTTSRIGYKIENGKKVRIAKKTGEVI